MFLLSVINATGPQATSHILGQENIVSFPPHQITSGLSTTFHQLLARPHIFLVHADAICIFPFMPFACFLLEYAFLTDPEELLKKIPEWAAAAS